MTIEIE